jgi:hypothetical protein
MSQVRALYRPPFPHPPLISLSFLNGCAKFGHHHSLLWKQVFLRHNGKGCKGRVVKPARVKWQALWFNRRQRRRRAFEGQGSKPGQGRGGRGVGGTEGNRTARKGAGWDKGKNGVNIKPARRRLFFRHPFMLACRPIE